MVVCAVVDCKNSQGSSVALFRFPNKESDTKRFWLWVERCRRKGKGSLKWEPHRSSRMCSEHFENDSFSRPPALSSVENLPKWRVSLCRDAVPTIFRYKTGISPRKSCKKERSVVRKRRLSEVRYQTLYMYIVICNYK